MGKKKTDEGKQSGKEGKENKKIFVSAMLADMDTKPDKLQKPSSRYSSCGVKPRSKLPQNQSSYMDSIDLPPDDDDDDDDSGDESRLKQAHKHKLLQRKSKDEPMYLEIAISGKQQKKLEKKEMDNAQAAERVKAEALKDDRDVFNVTIGSRISVLDGQEVEAVANVKDIAIDSFSVSAQGKELLKNASCKISHGKRYGLVGPNGKGKSTLLKLLAWKKIPLPKNIDVLLVEQEVVGDDKTALEAVVSANEELIKIWQEVASLQEDVEDDDIGEKLSELYEKLRLMGSEAVVSKTNISTVKNCNKKDKSTNSQPPRHLSG